MQLTDIEGSSAVKAAGFADGTIRVLFQSGHWKDFEGRTEAEFAQLLASSSKGRFVRDWIGDRPGSGAGAFDQTRKDRPSSLDTFDTDDCCSPRLSRVIGSGKLAGVESWTCPVCEVEWTPESSGLGRHWKPRSWSAVFR